MLFSTKPQDAWAPAWKSPAMPAIKLRTIIISTVAIFISVIVAASILHPEPIKNAYHGFKDSAMSTYSTAASSISEHARNSTLGFQKVFYISLPYRTDRQDAMTLLSDMAGIDSTYEPGVDGAATPDGGKVIGSGLTPSTFGCWRSHANLWRKIITENISTALIFEDDIDFDVDIKGQLFRLSEGIQNGPNLIDNDPRTPVDKSAPYGSAWDLFFIGYCHHKSIEEPLKHNVPYSTVEDPTVLDMPQLNSHHTREFEKFGVETNGTRLIVPLHGYYCTQGYAVSQEGAKRLLYHMGYQDIGAPVDNAMSGITTRGGLRGIAPVPPLLSQWKVSSHIDSNINNPKFEASGKVDKEKGHGFGLVKNSARKAMKDWVKWEEPEPKPSQKPKSQAAAQA